MRQTFNKYVVYRYRLNIAFFSMIFISTHSDTTINMKPFLFTVQITYIEILYHSALFSSKIYDTFIINFIFINNNFHLFQVFVSLQGLVEPDRFAMLTKLVNGSLKLEEVKIEATRLKRTNLIRQMFVQLSSQSSWEACRKQFPAHTETEALDNFISEYILKYTLKGQRQIQPSPRCSHNLFFMFKNFVDSISFYDFIAKSLSNIFRYHLF